MQGPYVSQRDMSCTLAPQFEAVASSLFFTNYLELERCPAASCPLLLQHDDAGVGAGVLGIMHDAIRLVVVSVVEWLKTSGRKDVREIK
jgi:hypothetical protein